MILGPLDDAASRDLVLLPLADLGFEIEDCAQLLDDLFKLTGQLPHLLQFCSRKLVEFVLEDNAQVISRRQFGRLLHDSSVAACFLSALESFDPALRQAALRFLRDCELSPNARVVLPAPTPDSIPLRELYDNLLVHNILARRGDRVTLACEGLPRFARRAGWLENLG
jgi:hypothetical protein